MPELEDELENGDGSEEIYERVNLIVDKGQEPLRIDKFIQARIEGATRNKVQQSIEKGMVLVNDKPVKANYKVRPLDRLIVYSTKTRNPPK